MPQNQIEVVKNKISAITKIDTSFDDDELDQAIYQHMKEIAKCNAIIRKTQPKLQLV